MKKLFFLFLISISAVSLFAWEPNDLTKYPSSMNGNTWILNFGVGYYPVGNVGGDYIYVPPLRLSLDKNVPIGDRNLPFFIGGVLTYSGEGYRDSWYYSRIGFGGRFGYHFNWGVDKLDTYAVTTAGWVFYAGDDDWIPNPVGYLLFGVTLGARYFISEGFGFWAEVGYNSFSYFDIGLAFKF
jgi:hypothetical protein